MMTNEEMLASLADAVDRTYHHKDDAGLLDEIARRLREQDGERIEGVLLPDSRLRSMIAGAFRYGTERERAGEIKGLESSYIESEHHANRLVDEFIKAGHITVHPQEPEK